MKPYQSVTSVSSGTVIHNIDSMHRRYIVGDPIASGTYGTIYHCKMTEEYGHVLQQKGAHVNILQNLCAVKVQRHDAFFWENFSFLREIDALMRTRKFPGTVNVLDCVLDTERECAFIVMDCFDGTLQQYINQVPLSERIACLPFICTQLILTLAYLDSEGIAHRDMKPSNILVQKNVAMYGGNCCTNETITDMFSFCADVIAEDFESTLSHNIQNEKEKKADFMKEEPFFAMDENVQENNNNTELTITITSKTIKKLLPVHFFNSSHSNHQNQEESFSEDNSRPRSFPDQFLNHLNDNHTFSKRHFQNKTSAGDLASCADKHCPFVVICDFGLAKQLGPVRDTPCLVTLNFRPPEMFVDCDHSAQQKKIRYGANVDVWSLGCILIQFITGNLLFNGTNDLAIMGQISEFVGGIPKCWSCLGWNTSVPVSDTDRFANIVRRLGFHEIADKHEFCDLLCLMLHPQPSKRPNANLLLSHPYVKRHLKCTMHFMCQNDEQHLFSSQKRERIGNGSLQATAHWAFQHHVDTCGELLDPRLGLVYATRISSKDRESICEWMWNQNRTLNYNPGTVLSSIYNLDRFMSYASTHTLQAMTLQTFVLSAIVCYYLTAHYCEKYVVDLQTLITSSPVKNEINISTSKDVFAIQETIKTVLVALHYQISTPSHWTLYCRHRETMHMSKQLDSKVSFLLYCLLRKPYHAASISKSILLTMAVEKIRFNRIYEGHFSKIRLNHVVTRFNTNIWNNQTKSSVSTRSQTKQTRLLPKFR